MLFVGSLPMHSQLFAETQNDGKTSAVVEFTVPPQVQAELDKLQDALVKARVAGDAKAEANALNNTGVVYYRLGEKQKALDYYNQALLSYRQADERVGEAGTLANIGLINSDLGEQQKALEYYNQALPIMRQMGNRGGEASVLSNTGSSYFILGQRQKALEYYNQALPIMSQMGNRMGEANVLNNIGLINSDLGEKQKAIEYYNQALPLYREVGYRAGEATTLMNIGNIYSDLGEKRKAIDYHNQTLTIYREIGDLVGEAKALNNIGSVYSTLDEKQGALDDFTKPLLIFQRIGDRAGEAGALMNIGFVSSVMGEKQEALEYYDRALPIMREVGLLREVAITINNIGNIYSDWSEKQKALDYYNQALPISRQVGDRTGEASALNNIGKIYFNLGEKQKALEFFNQVLPIFRSVGDRDDEANVLINMGIINSDLGEEKDALDYYHLALPIYRQVGDRDGEATALASIGNVYYVLGEKQKAMDYYNRTLPIHRQVGDRDSEAQTLSNIGNVYCDQGRTQEALENYNQALLLATAVSNPLLEAHIFHRLMMCQHDSKPSLAILYGKQAVNLLQQVRGNIQGLDKELQRSFLGLKGDYYHDLADLLIAQGRLPEAQQVLDLEKLQEYSDYVRGEKVNPASPLSLTPAEQQAEKDYQSSTAQLILLGRQWSDLKNIKVRTPEQEKKYQQLSNTLADASKGMNDYFSRLYVLFGKNSAANKQVADVKGDVSLLRQTIAKMPHTVALYTLVGEARYSVIVITASTTVARESAITEKDLNKKISAFQQVLRDPKQDPRPLAQELYRTLIGPVKADLNQAEAQTLVFSLDGALRYIPMAALYDGKQYLIENYNVVAFTPASIQHLDGKPDIDGVTAVAMGISRKYEDDLNPLPTVASELNAVVNDPSVKDANGVLPGAILLNGQFTEKAMENQLSGQHAVVHIASHFVLKPGDDSQSYLLLAGKENEGLGYHLTVADFRDDQKLSLDDTDLLTLSACETGVSGNAGNGREVDGLATTAQLKGAKAVISSLWPVNDSSTGDLMADFYRRWADSRGKVMKVEALRQAQLDLLAGKIKPEPDLSNPDAPISFTHPYYWAPFILMGNWR